MMLPRNGINTTKKEIKKQNSVVTTKIVGKGLPVALQRQESLPVDSEEYANRMLEMHMNRLNSAKPKAEPRLQPVRPQPQLQGSKSPKFGGGVPINSKPKNPHELNENIQSLQGMIGGQANPSMQLNTERKKPFGLLSGNTLQIPANIQKQHNFKPKSNDIQMDFDNDN